MKWSQYHIQKKSNKRNNSRWLIQLHWVILRTKYTRIKTQDLRLPMSLSKQIIISSTTIKNLLILFCSFFKDIKTKKQGDWTRILVLKLTIWWCHRARDESKMFAGYCRNSMSNVTVAESLTLARSKRILIAHGDEHNHLLDENQPG